MLDYRIEPKRMIRLRMAEGSLEMGNDVLPEAVVESYLMELNERNELGRPRSFKMHHLIRDFALSLSKEESFLTACDGEKEEFIAAQSNR